MNPHDHSLRIATFVGSEARCYIDEVARLRIEVFHEYPYLYVGNLDYEQQYLSTYFASSESLILIAFDKENRVRGASTAVPMIHEEEDFRRPFEQNGFDTREIFYFNESVIEKKFRGKGTGATTDVQTSRRALATHGISQRNQLDDEILLEGNWRGGRDDEAYAILAKRN